MKNVRWVCARCESGGTDEAAEARGHATSGSPNRAPRVTQSQEGEPSASCIKKTLQPSSSQLAPVTKYLTPTNKSTGVDREFDAVNRSISGDFEIAKKPALNIIAQTEEKEMAPSRVDAGSERSAEKSLNQRDRESNSSRKSRSSVATALKLERLAREQEMEMDATRALYEEKFAKLSSSYDAMRQQIQYESASRKGGSTIALSEVTKGVNELTNGRAKTTLPKPSTISRECSPTLKQEPATSIAADMEHARRIWNRKLPNFSGSVKQWPIFYSYYNRSTEACGFTSVENIMRLEEALTGPAREVVESKFTSPNAAPQIIKMLKQL